MEAYRILNKPTGKYLSRGLANVTFTRVGSLFDSNAAAQVRINLVSKYRPILVRDLEIVKCVVSNEL